VDINKNTGSSTCTIAKLSEGENNILKTLNMGDSGYLLVRPDGEGKDGKLKRIHRTKEQQHSFNFPF
jgi:hypothetical protein